MTSQRGFTLIEMAIVLVIITILIGGLAMPLSAQIQARRVAETKKTLDEARDALLGYAMMTATNPLGAPQDFRYFPCPDVTGDGIEDRSGAACSSSVNFISYGWLPWVTLGTASQDAWGNRLRYAIVSQYANSDTGFFRKTPTTSSFIQICTTRTCPSPLVASNAVFALISHGPNGWGALNVNGTTLALPSGGDEAQNLAQSLPVVTRTPTQANAALGEFDDLVAWLPATELILRVCPTGSSCDHN